MSSLEFGILHILTRSFAFYYFLILQLTGFAYISIEEEKAINILLDFELILKSN